MAIIFSIIRTLRCVYFLFFSKVKFYNNFLSQLIYLAILSKPHFFIKKIINYFVLSEIQSFKTDWRAISELFFS